jgi:acetyl-CoA acyltransferase
MEDLAALKTPFRPHGRVTAGTLAAHRRRDDVAARRRRRRQGARSHPEDAHGLVRLRRRAAGDHGHRPDPSTEKALKKAGLTIADIGLFELNEAFAVQVISLSTTSASPTTTRASTSGAGRSPSATRSPRPACA